MPYEQLVADCIERYRQVPGGLLPLLHAVQEIIGHIPEQSVVDIATGLKLSPAEVHGVISFYEDFRTQPAGRHRVQVCRAEACQAMGGRALQAHARQQLGLDWGGTTADGNITLEAVYCLGNCACSPSLRIDDTVHARVDASRFDELMVQLLGEAEE